MRSPRDFFRPLALGAPEPVRDIPVRPSRMIHFFDPSNPRMAEKAPDIATKVDILLGNMEDAVAIDNKVAAREGFINIARDNDFGDTQLWTRVNSLDSPWFLDDVTRIVTEVGDKVDVIMLPKVQGPWDIHYVDQLVAQLEARVGSAADPAALHPRDRPRRRQRGRDRQRQPRIQGMSLGPADLAASRRMKTTRIGGGHPGYLVRNDPDPETRRRREPHPGPVALHDRAHGGCLRRVGALPFYGPFGAIDDPLACEDQFRNAFLMGCVGAWSLHPSQIEIAKKVFSPPAGGRLGQTGAGGAAGRFRRGHGRRQDAGRRLLETVQGHGGPGQAHRREGRDLPGVVPVLDR